MNIILLGAPGSGKGTQAKFISKTYGLPQISTGDIFRENIKNGTELGKKAKEFMDAGKLVPDTLVIDILKDRIEKADCKNGYILDGFPRTIPQAEALEKIATIDCVILIDLPFDVIEKRAINRRVCKACGEIFNIDTYGSSVCDKCGAPLFQRDDDKLETVRNRLKVYEQQTAPLIDFYSAKLHKVSSLGSVEETSEAVRKILDKKENNVER